MKPGSCAVVGAAESTELGKIPHMSNLQLHADSALNALADCGLTTKDIDGVACAGESPVNVAHYLGITPTYTDGTQVGGCSFLLHVRHAAAAINEGLCTTVLITHGESGKSRIGRGGRGFGGGRRSPVVQGQFEAPYGPTGAPTLFTIPYLRYAKEYGVTPEELATVAVVQREWAGKNPRAYFRDPITVDDVMNSRYIAYPFHLFECCLVTDGGGALIIASAERAKDFPTNPVYIMGTGESCETPMVSQMEDFRRSKAFHVASKKAFDESGMTTADIDHVMIYDAFAHLPFYGLEAMGFCQEGEAPQFIAERNTAPGGALPLNTNGGGLSYTHTGMYGMFALQESVRQVRGTAPAQVDGVTTSVALGVGGMFAASGCIIFSNEAP